MEHLPNECANLQASGNDTVSIIGVRRPHAKTWNLFSHRCNASFLCARSNVARYVLSGKQVRYFEFYAAGSKIGQCAIASSRLMKSHQFIDCIQLVPRAEYLWLPAMQLVLAAVGRGRYSYGSPWNVERPRDKELARLPGVIVEKVLPHAVQAIEFSRWQSWSHYEADISRNVLENAARALASRAEVRRHSGLETLKSLASFMTLRRDVAKRKELPFSVLKATLRFIVRSFLFRDAIGLNDVRIGATVTASGVVVRHGSQYAFVDCASRRHNGGGAWLMTLSILRDSFERTPNGIFVVGADEYCRTDRQGWPNLNRFRQSLRVSYLSSSFVEFTYAPLMPISSSCDETRHH